MTFELPNRRPKIRRHSGIWYCTGDGVSVGQGPTPSIAYKNWRRINTVMSRWHDTDPDSTYGKDRPYSRCKAG